MVIYMVTISLCMIVKNEEAVLRRCLDSVKEAVDEIIIVDTGSVDKTKEIAAEYTPKVYDFVWIDDFSAARNEAFSKAAMDYQLWLDADDVVPPAQLEKLIALKSAMPPDTDMVTMKYHTHFDEFGSPVHTSTRERLLKRENGYRWQDPIHEFIPLGGKMLESDIEIWHMKPGSEGSSDRNLKIYEGIERSGGKMSPRQQYYFARELKDHGSYAKAVYYFEKFLNGGMGWVEDNIAACVNLAVCYRLLDDCEKMPDTLFKSFHYDSPRAENCCELGYYYKMNGRYKTALFWFSLAAVLDQPESLGFILRDYWGYIPNIEACVCCYELGEYADARKYNEKAAVFKPESVAVEQNRKALEGK